MIQLNDYSKGVSVLHCAVENGQKEIVSELLDNDCDPYILADFVSSIS